MELLILPCLVLGCLADNSFGLVEVLYAFSMYLEAVAILPQVHMANQLKRVEPVVRNYIAVLSVYKLCHVADVWSHFNWDSPFKRIAVAGACIQLMFYLDFFLTGVPTEQSGDDIEEAKAACIRDPDADERRRAKEEETLRSASEQRERERQNEGLHNNLKEVVLAPGSLVKDAKVGSSGELDAILRFFLWNLEFYTGRKNSLG